jgi:arylsulfatase A-like enzyme
VGIIKPEEQAGPVLWKLPCAAHAAAVLAATAALAVFGCRSRGSGASGERPNVILISLDTVRADRLGIYGYALPTTPEIDRFFSESAIRFDAVFAPQPFTLTSHLTMLTSLHPAVHGVDSDRSLPPGVRTLADVLASDGYVTVGSVFDVAWMHERYGFGRGFHIYQRLLGDIRSRAPSVDALLDDLEDERFFLFLHHYDAHSDWGGFLPYDSDPQDRAAFSGWYHGNFAGCDAGGRCATDLLSFMNRERRTLPEEDRRYVSSLYDAGLRTLDRGLGDFFRRLGARGLLDRTIVVLTADHGEEFQEHGQLLHEQAYDESMHVPLLIRVPGAGGLRVSSRLVSLEDIAPTILDFCGSAPPPEMQGRSLRPLVTGGTDTPERSKLLMMDKNGDMGLRTATWKILTTKSGTQLYDLVRDPAERNDLMAHRPPPPEAEQLRRDLEAEVQHAFRLRARLGVPGERGISLSESQKEQLRALGYLR